MSWDNELLERAHKIIELYPQKRSALGPLLYLAQEKDGFISDDSIVEISNLVDITEGQVKSVSSFYSMYKEVVLQLECLQELNNLISLVVLMLLMEILSI